MRDFRPLFEPRSVAVVGASADPAKWGHWLARGALEGESRRSVFLVNRNGGEILGRRVHCSLADLPEPPELVALTVPASSLEESIEAALDAGARALVAITAGLDEIGERAVAERVRSAGALLVGPNCLGIYDAGAELRLASNEFPAGSIGFISQSGNLALELGLLAADAELGFSRVVSIGNQADVEVAELVTAFAAHDATHVIAVYCEDFRDGRGFVDACAHAGKPVLVLAGGRGRAGRSAARSHTGALVSDAIAVDAACRAGGMIPVHTPAELIDTAQALVRGPRPRGRRIGVVADGGGHGIVCADVAEAAGLELPPLSDRLAARLAESLPPAATTRNPVDLAGGGEQDTWSFERVARQLLESQEVDAVVLTGYFGGYGAYASDFVERELAVARALAEAAAETGRPVVVHTMYPSSAPAAELRRCGIPVYRTTEAAVETLARLTRSTPNAPAARDTRRLGGDYWGARRLLASAGIPLVEARRVSTVEDALVAARELGYPVAVKAAALLHKAEAGGVALGVETDSELERAFAQVSEVAPPDYSVERMAPPGGAELIVGIRRDVRFGPILLVGLGGTHAEVLRDTAVALAPVDESEALGLLRSLAGYPLLKDLDVAAAARAAASLSRLPAAELEINPLLVLPDGVLGLDARLGAA